MMDERQIKKPNQLFPKMFRTFTVYIFATLLVFFGYVQLFGDVKPNILQLPVDSGDAEDDSYFGSFVQNMMNFKNIDTNILLTFSNDEIDFSVEGNVIFAESGISLDIDLGYNGQNFDVQATYVNPNIYLTIDETSYKFDINSGIAVGGSDLDLVQMLKFVTEVLDIDLSFVDEIGKFLGIDLKNFNPNDLLENLKIEEKLLDDGRYNFKIRLGSAIEATLVCDEKFNIISAESNKIKINNNALKLVANVNKMNNVDVKTGEETVVEVKYQPTGDEIDLAGMAEYVSYAENLFKNQHVSVDIAVNAGDRIFNGKIYVDCGENFAIKFATEIESLDVQIVYTNENVYLDVDGLKLRFAIKDLKEWQKTIDQILLKYTGKNVADTLKEFLSKYIDIEQIEGGKFNFNSVLKEILDVCFSNSETLTAYLPSKSSWDENSYSLSWDNGLKVELQQQKDLLQSISATCDKFRFNAEFDVVDNAIEVNDQYLDLVKFKNLLEYVDEGIFEFDFTLSYNDWNVCGEQSKGTLKYFDGDLEIVCANLCGEQFSVRVHTDKASGQKTAYVAYGNMKIKISIPEKAQESSVDIWAEINKLTSGYFGVKLDFGVFAEILDILQNYTLKDCLDKMIIDMSNNPNEICFTLSNKQQFTTSDILKAKMAFEGDLLHSISLDVYDVINAEVSVNHTEKSTIKDFNADDFADYSENFVDGLFDSLQTEENVFAFASDIAIRYSNNTFYGNLTAMIVRSEKQDESGNVVEIYTPAISLYTTSLGLSAYIYMIDRTVYIDIDGLQIQADLNETTITEIMDFVTENFGQFLPKADEGANENSVPLEPAAEAFKVIIPALDRIYGKWVSYVAEEQTINGVQIEIGNTVKREDIVEIEKVFNEETEEFDEIEHYSNDVSDYGGESNVLMYAQDCWFYNIILQAYIQNLNSTIVPTKVVLGANIHDPNTILQADYTDFLLPCEEPSTSNLNFAVYLTNISVGEFVENLGSIFISDTSGYQNIYAVKSNISEASYDFNKTGNKPTEEKPELIVTDLEQFNSYKTLLGVVKTTYDYAMGMEYQVEISGSVSNATSTTMIDGDVAVQVKDLPEGAGNLTGIKLFNEKELNVQVGLDVKTNYKESLDETTGNQSFDARHLIDLFYESNGFGLYATYQHSNYSDNTNLTDNIESGDAFRAKVANANLSEIISMMLAFANVDLGESMTNLLSLPVNMTDFAFLQELLGMTNHTDVSDTVSKVDGLLDSIENITRMIKQISLYTTQDLTTTLMLKLDFDANDKILAGQNIAYINVVFKGQQTGQNVSYTLAKIILEDVVLGENKINLSITFGKFDENSSFNYDTTAEHIDFSEVSSFVDLTVNTINTQGFQFGGEMTLSLIGIDAIKSKLDLEINLSDEGDVTAHIEVRTDAFMGATWGGINPRFTTWETFSKRVATLDIADGQLKLVQKTYQSRGRVKTLFDKVYVGNEILDNIVEIFAETLGLTDLAYNVMKDQISKIEAHPTLERAILGYRKEVSEADVDKYVLSLAGENVTGMSGFKDFDLNITSSAPYAFNYNGIEKQVKFLQAISTFIDIAGAVKIDLNLSSVTDKGDLYCVDDDVIYDFHTNEYYRKRYINHVHDIQFRENGGENVQDIVNVTAGETITLPTLANKVTYEQHAHTKTTWQFDGWWTTSTYQRGTKFLANVAPDKNLVLYAKWKAVKVENIYIVNIYHNDEIVETFNLLAGETLSRADFGNLEGLSSHGAEFYYMEDNSKFTTLTACKDVNLYFKNYYAVSFDISWVKPANWMNDGSINGSAPTNPETFLVLEGTEIYPTDYAISNVKYKYGIFSHSFKMVTWNTTGCTSVAKGITKAEGNKSYTVLESLIVNSDTTLYATWAWA